MKTVGVSTPGVIILGPNQSESVSAVSAAAPEDWKVEIQKREDKSLNDVMNRFVRERPDFAWYGFIQDDLSFETPEWDLKLIEAAGSLGIASCNDRWRAPKRNTGACVFGGDLIRLWGFWAPPKLQHSYMDDFWEESGRECKNWKVLMEVKTPHLHYANGKAPKDATYDFAYAPGGQDKREWIRFRTSPEYFDRMKKTKALLHA